MPPFYREGVLLLAAAGGPVLGAVWTVTTSIAPLQWFRFWSLSFLAAIR